MKKIFIIFILLISLCACSDENKILDAKLKTCSSDSKVITLNKQQALNIYNIFKDIKLNNKVEAHAGCLGSFEISSDDDIVSFTVVDKNIIAYNNETYKVNSIDLYLETIKTLYNLEDKPSITLDDIRSLVNIKGEALTYDDFKDYLHIDVGSGLTIYSFPIDHNYSLLISDFSDDIKNDYIELHNDSHEKIDIRYDDINTFIK